MKHVVVVEDDPMNARLFRMVLERRGGWKVTVTEDPAELLRLARSGDVQAVVMDVSLHDSRWQGRPVNGVDLCRLLKDDPQTAGIPILLATAHAMRGDEQRFLVESGADDYVSKPVMDHAAFVTQMRRWVEPEAA
jgi:two-component system, cell cycle response regulator DivK